MRNPFVSLCLVASIAMLAACGSDTAPNPQDPVVLAPVAERYPIDGTVNLSAMSGVQSRQVSMRDYLGEGDEVNTITVRWALDNDDRHLYVALEWDDATHDNDFDLVAGPLVFDGVRLVFDEDGSGAHDIGEDSRTVIAASVNSQYVDIHRVTPGQNETDAIGDGFAKLKYDAVGGMYSAEFLVTLSDDANGDDGPLTAGTRYNILIIEGLDLTQLTGNGGTVFADLVNSAAWPSLLLKTDPVTPHPRIPTGLSGMIVFLSDHEVAPNGEIYAFNPATGAVTRVTNQPNLFKDNISLSHDLTKVAFHGAASKTDYNAYEIYTIDTDGNNLTQLTNNGVLDGHPAWSPDDSRLVYASFRGGVGASLVIMSNAGVEIVDLTQGAFDDNDPEYTPDGRIVFKTGRFSTLPEVRIAVMNDDGSGVVQLTDVSPSSDHDPAGDDNHCLFERFPKNTHYATDVEAGFIGWAIVEVAVATSTERTLMADGWINWLPVYDPTSAYIAYLKGSGTTAAHLMTRDGAELGRLIPNMTHIRYIDWK